MKNMTHTKDTVTAVSKSRYRAPAAHKRIHGGATITVFWVYRESAAKDPSKWKEIEGFGKTPGERRTDAIRKFEAGES